MDLTSVKAAVKAWEKSFVAAHGRKPTKEDVKSDPGDIAEQYTLYRKLSKNAPSASASASASQPPSASSSSSLFKLPSSTATTTATRTKASSSDATPSSPSTRTTPRVMAASEYPTTPTPPARRAYSRASSSASASASANVLASTSHSGDQMGGMGRYAEDGGEDRELSAGPSRSRSRSSSTLLNGDTVQSHGEGGEQRRKLKRTASKAALTTSPSSSPIQITSTTLATKTSTSTPTKASQLLTTPRKRPYAGPIHDPTPNNPFAASPLKARASPLHPGPNSGFGGGEKDELYSPFIHTTSPQKFRELLRNHSSSVQKVKQLQLDRSAASASGGGTGAGAGAGGSGNRDRDGYNPFASPSKSQNANMRAIPAITPRTKARRWLTGEGDIDATPGKARVRKKRGGGKVDANLSAEMDQGQPVNGNGSSSSQMNGSRAGQEHGKDKGKGRETETDIIDEMGELEDEFGPSPMKPPDQGRSFASFFDIHEGARADNPVRGKGNGSGKRGGAASAGSKGQSGYDRTHQQQDSDVSSGNRERNGGIMGMFRSLSDKTRAKGKVKGQAAVEDREKVMLSSMIYGDESKKAKERASEGGRNGHSAKSTAPSTPAIEADLNDTADAIATRKNNFSSPSARGVVLSSPRLQTSSPSLHPASVPISSSSSPASSPDNNHRDRALSTPPLDSDINANATGTASPSNFKGATRPNAKLVARSRAKILTFSDDESEPEAEMDEWDPEAGGGAGGQAAKRHEVRIVATRRKVVRGDWSDSDEEMGVKSGHQVTSEEILGEDDADVDVDGVGGANEAGVGEVDNGSDGEQETTHSLLFTDDDPFPQPGSGPTSPPSAATGPLPTSQAGQKRQSNALSATQAQTGPSLLSILSLTSPPSKSSKHRRMEELRYKALFNPSGEDAKLLKAMKRGQEVFMPGEREEDGQEEDVLEGARDLGSAGNGLGNFGTGSLRRAGPGDDEQQQGEDDDDDDGGDREREVADDDWESESDGWKRTGREMEDDVW